MRQNGPSTHNEVAAHSIGASLQARDIHGDVHLHGHAPAEPEPDPPRGWDELPEPPAAIASLLHAQVEAAHDLPYRLPGAHRPSLAAVHVRQELGSEVDDEPKEERSTPVVDGRGQVVDQGPTLVRRTVRPPSRTIAAALDDDDHIVVTGGPGQGKSTLSLRLAADLGARWLRTAEPGKDVVNEPVAPLRVTARVLARHLARPFPQALLHSVREEHGAMLGPDVDECVLNRRVAGCRWLLLVDGLDEVANAEDRGRLVRVLATWAFRPGSPYRVLLTTRPVEGTALAPMQRVGSNRYELQPFDDDALALFAANWFADPEEADRFLAQLAAAHLTELVRVPLLATIAAIVYQQHRDRPLPDNQYELYESYLRYLRRVPDTDCLPLMEHLGRIRVEQDTSLVAAVAAWADAHPGVETDELVDRLTTVGPFTRRGDDLHFLHHSFAEHLAATAAARLLPADFAPHHAAFADLLHTARPKQGGRYARAILLHYTRLCPGQADPLLRWLHSGLDDQHLLAARLLAAHLPAGENAIADFLGTVRAWAMATGSVSLEILAQASRACHFGGLVRWLLDLMRDGSAPIASRVEAATALGTRLRGAERAEALSYLVDVVDDADARVEARVAAAEALSECGEERRAAAERGLRAVVADPDIESDDLRRACVVLAGFGGDARRVAVDALIALLDDRWATDTDLVDAATALVEIGAEHHDRCAAVFRQVLADRCWQRPIRQAGLGLASLGSERADEAASLLVDFAADRLRQDFDRVTAATTLADLGPHRRALARDLLSAMADEQAIRAAGSWRLADALAALGCQELAHKLLRRVLDDPDSSPNAQLWAARGLTELGPAFEAEAIHALESLLAHPGAGRYDRPAALSTLARVSEDHRASAVDRLRALMTDLAGDPMLSCHAAANLVDLGPEHHAEAVAGLTRILRAQVPVEVRLRAWDVLRTLREEDSATTELLVDDSALDLVVAKSWSHVVSLVSRLKAVSAAARARKAQ